MRFGRGTGLKRANQVRQHPVVSYIKVPSYATANIMGDSYTTGSLASSGANAFPALLATALGFTLTNKGVSGSVFQNSNDSTGSPRADNGTDRFSLASTAANGGIIGSNAKAALFIALVFNDARYIGAPSTFNVAGYTNCARKVLNGVLTGGYAKADVYLASPWYITDTGLNTGSTGFSGQTRAGFVAFVDAARAVALEYGIQFTDMYAALNTPAFIADVDGQDHVHPANVGHALIRDAWVNRTERPNTKPQVTISGASGAAGALTATIGTLSGAVDYTVEYGVEGTYAFPVTATVAGPTQPWTGIAGADYRLRARANFADGSHSPWAFAASATTVASAGGVDTVLGQTEGYASAVAGTLLEATSPTSGTWTKLSSQACVITGAGGGIRGSAVTSTVVSYRFASAVVGDPGITKVFAQADIKVLSNSAQLQAGVAVRIADSSNYLCAFYNGSNIRLFKRVGGTLTQIGSTYTVTISVGASKTIRLEASANAQQVFLDGVSIITGAEPDSNLTALGSGLGVHFQTGSTGWTNSTGGVLTSVTVGSIS